jgi:hypothetical protein
MFLTNEPTTLPAPCAIPAQPLRLESITSNNTVDKSLIYLFIIILKNKTR